MTLLELVRSTLLPMAISLDCEGRRVSVINKIAHMVVVVVLLVFLLVFLV